MPQITLELPEYLDLLRNKAEIEAVREYADTEHGFEARRALEALEQGRLVLSRTIEERISSYLGGL